MLFLWFSFILFIETGFYKVAQPGLKIMMCLQLQSSEFWDNRHRPLLLPGSSAFSNQCEPGVVFTSEAEVGTSILRPCLKINIL